MKVKVVLVNVKVELKNDGHLSGFVCSQQIVISMNSSLNPASDDFLSFDKAQEKPEKANNCNQCDFTSVHKGNLKRQSRIHMKTHSREKSHKCNQCDFASVEASRLRSHLNSHSGEKSYKCNQCDYASAQANNLRRHLKSHSGEKPHKCNRSNYASIQLVTLKRHVNIHTGEKSERCYQCDYASNDRGHLKNHLKTHAGEKPGYVLAMPPFVDSSLIDNDNVDVEPSNFSQFSETLKPLLQDGPSHCINFIFEYQNNSHSPCNHGCLFLS